MKNKLSILAGAALCSSLSTGALYADAEKKLNDSEYILTKSEKPLPPIYGCSGSHIRDNFTRHHLFDVDGNGSYDAYVYWNWGGVDDDSNLRVYFQKNLAVLSPLDLLEKQIQNPHTMKSLRANHKYVEPEFFSKAEKFIKSQWELDAYTRTEKYQKQEDERDAALDKLLDTIEKMQELKKE